MAELGYLGQEQVSGYWLDGRYSCLASILNSALENTDCRFELQTKISTLLCWIPCQFARQTPEMPDGGPIPALRPVIRGRRAISAVPGEKIVWRNPPPLNAWQPSPVTRF